MKEEDKATGVFLDFMNKKMESYRELLPAIKNRDRQRIREHLVENMVEDIFMIGKLRNIIGTDPGEPLHDKSREQLRVILLEYLK